MQPSLNEKTCSGYILIEICILFIVVGSLTATFFSVQKNYINRINENETNYRLEKITEALSVYSQMKWRLPCPSQSKNLQDKNYGYEGGGCSDEDVISAGIIPYKALGIPERFTRDAYGSYFTYVVASKFTSLNYLQSYDGIKSVENNQTGHKISSLFLMQKFCSYGNERAKNFRTKIIIDDLESYEHTPIIVLSLLVKGKNNSKKFRLNKKKMINYINEENKSLENQHIKSNLAFYFIRKNLHSHRVGKFYTRDQLLSLTNGYICENL